MRKAVQEWITHHSYRLWFTLLLAQCVLVLLMTSRHEVWWLSYVLPVVINCVDRGVHRTARCARCIRNRARGPERALQWHDSLQTYHSIAPPSRAAVLCFLGFILALYAAAGFIEGLFLTFMRLVVAAVWFLMAIFIAASGRHEHVQSWCPWCRRDDDDDDDDLEPPPVPTADGTLELDQRLERERGFRSSCGRRQAVSAHRP
jgi:hypothetical protein